MKRPHPLLWPSSSAGVICHMDVAPYAAEAVPDTAKCVLSVQLCVRGGIWCEHSWSWTCYEAAWDTMAELSRGPHTMQAGVLVGRQQAHVLQAQASCLLLSGGIQLPPPPPGGSPAVSSSLLLGRGECRCSLNSSPRATSHQH
jgi:hypothetical protein